LKLRIVAHEDVEGEWIIDVFLRVDSRGDGHLYAWSRPNSQAKEVSIADLFVKEELRRRGYGRLLVETFEHFAHSRGVSIVSTVFTKEAAVPFWEHVGYAKKKGLWSWWKKVDSLGTPSRTILDALEDADIKTYRELLEESRREEQAAEIEFLAHQSEPECYRHGLIRNLTPDEANGIIAQYLERDGFPPDTKVIITITRCDGRPYREIPLKMYSEWYNTASPHYSAVALFALGGRGVKLITNRDKPCGSVPPASENARPDLDGDSSGSRAERR